ncbi:MAG: DNA polymerase III subunit delta [Bacteroidales bacterium]|nr:DNA polymerase III subunit delta [Bacteroidales bacterium]
MAKQTTDTVQHFNSISKEILSGDIKPFYLLFGKEHYYIDKLCDLLMDKVLPPEEKDFGQLVYYGSEVSANQVVNAARQFPMMVSRQLVVVKEAQMMKKVEDIGVYFDGIQPTTVLVVCYKTPNDPTRSSRNIDKRTSFYKQAQKVGVVFESNQIPDYRLDRWIEEYARSKGLSIEPMAAKLMVEFAGTDISKVVLELDKLIKLLPEGHKSITVATVEENVGLSRDYSVFELTKALSLKDMRKAFRIVQFFSDSGNRYPIQMILAALSSHFFRILRYHALLQEGIPKSNILSQLGIHPYFGREYDTALRHYPVKKTMRVISLLKDYDQKSKSNSRGNATDGELLQELVLKIADS